MAESKKYNVIYADPPWSYDNKTTGRTDGNQPEGSGAATKYDLITLEELQNFPINDISDKDAVCFMWVVNPLLPEGLELLNKWGFKYKTMLTWKKNTGTGYWFIGRTEHILLGVKGNVPAFRSGLLGFHECKSGAHSAKPHYFRELISTAVKTSFEEPKKLELFARSREGFFPDYEYEGWDVYGNEVNNSIKLT